MYRILRYERQLQRIKRKVRVGMWFSSLGQADRERETPMMSEFRLDFTIAVS